jgi:hypothetical protein
MMNIFYIFIVTAYLPSWRAGAAGKTFSEGEPPGGCNYI